LYKEGIRKSKERKFAFIHKYDLEEIEIFRRILQMRIRQHFYKRG